MNKARQVKRQIELFMEDGEREHLTVALAILDEETSDETPVWHYNHPDNVAARAARRSSPHVLTPDGRGQGMRVCVKCGRTEPEPDEPCQSAG